MGITYNMYTFNVTINEKQSNFKDKYMTLNYFLYIIPHS
jgi:hypothetical protein